MATASTIIKTASNEIGVKETGNNNVKYNTEYYGKAVNGDAYPWCAVFVWWVFKHSGASSIFYGGGKTASVYEIWRYYNSLGRVYSSPKVGDLAIITTSAGGTYGHVGIVKSVSGNTYVTIDGNSKDQVRTTNRTVGSPKASFCRPAYGSGSGSSTCATCFGLICQIAFKVSAEFFSAFDTSPQSATETVLTYSSRISAFGIDTHRFS